MTATQKCAPTGSIYSWIGNCEAHHITRIAGSDWSIGRSEYPEVIVPGGISAEAFVKQFFLGLPLDPRNKDRLHFWYDNRTSQMKNTSCPPKDVAKDAEQLQNGTVRPMNSLGLESEENITNAAFSHKDHVWIAAVLVYSAVVKLNFNIC